MSRPGRRPISTEAYRLPAQDRTPPADDRRRADAHAAEIGRRPRAHRLFCGLRRRGRIRRGTDRAAGDASRRTIAQLFERAPPLGSRQRAALSSRAWRTIPKRSKRLQEMGFRDPSHSAGAIRGWHHGRIRATRSARARELLTKLVPAAARCAGRHRRSRCGVRAIRPLRVALAGGRAAVLAAARQSARCSKLVATIVGSAPRLADHLARAPADARCAARSRDFSSGLPSRAELDRTLAAAIAAVPRLTRLRSTPRGASRASRYSASACRSSRDVTRTAEAGAAFADIAECVIVQLLAAVEDELAAIPRAACKGGAFVRDRHGQTRRPRNDGGLRSRSHFRL